MVALNAMTIKEILKKMDHTGTCAITTNNGSCACNKPNHNIRNFLWSYIKSD